MIFDATLSSARLALNTIKHEAEQRQRVLPESEASAHAEVPTACAD
jgi:hypothetical protein